MQFGKILTPEEGVAFGVPLRTLVISFPPARPSQTSQKTSSLPSASGAKMSPGTASTSSEALPETEEDGALVQDRRRYQALQALTGREQSLDSTPLNPTQEWEDNILGEAKTEAEAAWRADPNRPETEADGIRAEAVRRFGITQRARQRLAPTHPSYLSPKGTPATTESPSSGKKPKPK